MSDDCGTEFGALAERLRAGLAPASVALLDRLIALDPKRHCARSFVDFGEEIVDALNAAAQVTPKADRRNLARALIATLAVDAMARIRAANVTPQVIERSRQWQPRLLRFLTEEADDGYVYPGDFFIKDYRYVHGLMVPCGARFLDLDARVQPKNALRLARQSPLAALRAISGRWYCSHTETRYLDDFTPEGWIMTFREIADLLEINPHMRGLVVTGWLYDPQLATVSPRLTYLREVPMSGGARLIRIGTGPHDISRATEKSATRRALYEEGKYIPVSYSIVWDRDDLIRWVKAGH
jgi:hypothetical protein